MTLLFDETTEALSEGSRWPMPACHTQRGPSLSTTTTEGRTPSGSFSRDAALDLSDLQTICVREHTGGQA